MVHKKKIYSIITIGILLASLALILTPNVSAVAKTCYIRGYVYVDGVITTPEEVKILISNKEIKATIPGDPEGYYILDFTGEIGDTGVFHVTTPAGTWQANETITIKQNQDLYKINLTINTSQPPINNCPEINNPNPPDKATNQATSITLSVHVSDPDDDKLDIYFYWNNGTLIGTKNNIPSGETASIGPLSLTCNKLYSWYVIANDSALQNTSDTWSFTTQSCSPVNHPPDKPVDPVPENNSENIRLNPQLSVYVTDPDDDSLSVSFYNAENNELIDKIDNVENATRATVTWPGLSFNTNYSWYVVVNDSEFETYSDIFSFKTIEEDNTPPSVFFETPEKGSLYIFGNKITLPGLIKTTFILGNLTIAVNATDNQSGINRVELTIKSKWCHEITENLTESPYTYKWNRLGFGLYNLTATVYDLAGNSANTSIVVRKFL